MVALVLWGGEASRARQLVAVVICRLGSHDIVRVRSTEKHAYLM